MELLEAACDLKVNLFHFAGELLNAAHGRVLQASTHVLAEFIQVFSGLSRGSKPCRKLDIAFNIAAYELAKITGAQKGSAGAGDPAVSFEGDYGNALPNGFCSGCTAVIGEGVQGDIDLAVGFEEFVVRRRTFENESSRIDVVCCKKRANKLLVLRGPQAGVFQEQRSAGGILQNFAPDCDDVRSDLILRREAAKSHCSVLKAGRRGHGGYRVVDLKSQI